MRQPAGQLAALLAGDAAGRAGRGRKRHAHNGDEDQQANGPDCGAAAGLTDERYAGGVAVDEVAEACEPGEAVEGRGAEKHRHHRDGAGPHRQGGQVIERVSHHDASGSGVAPQRRQPGHGHAVHLEGIRAGEPPRPEHRRAGEHGDGVGEDPQLDRPQ